MEVVGGSASPSPCSSYQPSPASSSFPSPASSSFPSPASSSYITNGHNGAVNSSEVNSLVPFLTGLASASSSASKAPPPQLQHLYMRGGSISAPVTPPLSSPTARTPRIKTDWDDPAAPPLWFLPSSSTGGPSSPTFSLVSSNPFGGFLSEVPAARGVSAAMWTPVQSGTCSPAVPEEADVPMPAAPPSEEFAFGGGCGGTGSNENAPLLGPVKAWAGERIHEECGSDDLELTLGSSKSRSNA